MWGKWLKRIPWDDLLLPLVVTVLLGWVWVKGYNSGHLDAQHDGDKIMPDSLRSPRIPAVPFIADIPRGATAGAGESSPAIHLVYSPAVHIKEATPGTSTADAIKQALKENLPELERLLDEIIRRKQRRSFDA
ncbi:hypothetical protein [Salmonella enterica]|uniref:hypothetical protein n=1 Tax=Salmonella enterica TaxID=28901 RepID=UPI003D31D108